MATQTGSESCIDKLHNLVRWIHSSPQRSKCFEDVCVSCGVPGKKVVLDVCTRWNSTYAIIQRACELRVPLSEMTKMVAGLSKLNNEEWVVLEVASQVLGPFFLLQPFILFDAAITVPQILSVFDKATRVLCAADYPTLNKAVWVYNYLIDELEYFLGRCNNEEEGRQRAAIVDRCNPTAKCALTAAMEAARARLIEFYSTTWAGMYAVALILDPSSKMKWYRARGWNRSAVTYAKDALLKVIEEYGRTPEAPAVPRPSHAISLADSFDSLCDVQAQTLKRRRVEEESELERYLAAPIIEPHTDVLQWWKRNAGEYPCLARIARDYLAISATSAPAERAFSRGADLIAAKRGSMDEETIRICMCVGSWMRLLSP